MSVLVVYLKYTFINLKMFQFSPKRYWISILSRTLQVYGPLYTCYTSTYTQAYLIKWTSSVLLFAKGDVHALCHLVGKAKRNVANKAFREDFCLTGSILNMFTSNFGSLTLLIIWHYNSILMTDNYIFF